MIPITLKIVALVSLLFYFAGILYLLRKKSIYLKYTLMWIFAGIIMGILIIFPGILEKIANAIGIQVASNAAFAMLLFFILLILMELTSIVSKLSEKNKNLIQTIALVEKRIRELENKIEL